MVRLAKMKVKVKRIISVVDYMFSGVLSSTDRPTGLLLRTKIGGGSTKHLDPSIQGINKMAQSS